MKIVYALQPSSFCFGVEKSIIGLHAIIKQHPDEEIFCIHALVHNPKVTKLFETQGVTFVSDIDMVKNPDAIIVFSAHGTDRNIIDAAKQKYKKVYNLECPFVSKIYSEADNYLTQGIQNFVYIGEPTHQEGKNVISYIKSKGAHVTVISKGQTMLDIMPTEQFAVLSQTTINFEAVQDILKNIQDKYPSAHIPKQSDVCKATYDRQSVILQNLEKFETFIVIGGKESNNTKELYEIGKKHNKQTFYGESLADIVEYPHNELFAYKQIAITGGASTPKEDIQEVVDFFVGNGYKEEILSLV